jgi:hypothetical protein
MDAEQLPVGDDSPEARVARLKAAEDRLIEQLLDGLLEAARLRAHELDADSA